MSSFTITPKDSLEATLDRVRTTISNKGGQFSGDTNNGQFSGNTPVGAVKGKYVVKNGNLEITITDKPFLAPMSIIEDKIRNYFA